MSLFHALLFTPPLYVFVVVQNETFYTKPIFGLEEGKEAAADQIFGCCFLFLNSGKSVWIEMQSFYIFFIHFEKQYSVSGPTSTNWITFLIGSCQIKKSRRSCGSKTRWDKCKIKWWWLQPNNNVMKLVTHKMRYAMNSPKSSRLIVLK